MEISVGDQTLIVWVADVPDERARGLMGVSRLPDGIDGMMFVYDRPSFANFHMAGTTFDLDVWWFDAEGRLIGSTPMEPCPAQPCLTYPSPAAIMWALETPLGEHRWEPGVTLSTG